MFYHRNIVIFIMGLLYASASLYARPIVDASGKTIRVSENINRVVSLTPNITELIFSAGAGHKIIGTVAYSDYPEPAKKIPIIGTYENLNLEALLRLKPDLILAWQNGTSQAMLAKIRSLGLKVFMIDASSLPKIPATIQTLGTLLGTEKTANAQAKIFRKTLAALKPIRSTHAKVFIQIWDRPLITLNQHTIFSEIVNFCGGENIFANQPILAPKITIESVLQRNPDVILLSGNSNPNFWDAWQHLPAVATQRIYSINPDHSNRATMRTLLAVKKICKILNTP